MPTYNKTTINTLNWSIELYNATGAYQGTLNRFILPAWAIDNFNRNKNAKAIYNLSANEKYADATEDIQEQITRDIFNKWSASIWDIIRTRIGLRLDIIGYELLSPQRQDLLRQAIAHQINHWRVNLPWEISQNVTRISGNISTTINATEFITGYDALSSLTKTSILNAQIAQENLEGLIIKRYREDGLINALNALTARINALEQAGAPQLLDSANYLTKTTALNTFEKINPGYLTQQVADQRYLNKDDAIGSSSAGAYFQNETLTRNQPLTKRLLSTTNNELRETRSPGLYKIEFLQGNNVLREYTMDSVGFKIDGDALLQQSQLNAYLLKSEFAVAQQGQDDALIAERNRLNTAIGLRLAVSTFNSEIAKYVKAADVYSKDEVDQKIIKVNTDGQASLENYYNIQYVDALFSKNSALLIGNNAGAANTEAYIGDRFAGTQRWAQNSLGEVYIYEGGQRKIFIGSASGEGLIRDKTGAITFDKIINRDENILNKIKVAKNSFDIKVDEKATPNLNYNPNGNSEPKTLIKEIAFTQDILKFSINEKDFIIHKYNENDVLKIIYKTTKSRVISSSSSSSVESANHIISFSKSNTKAEIYYECKRQTQTFPYPQNTTSTSYGTIINIKDIITKNNVASDEVFNDLITAFKLT